MNWINNYCIKTYSHTNSNISSFDRSSSSHVRSWMTPRLEPFPKVVSICAQTCHYHTWMQKDVCHMRIRSWKKHRNFLYGPLQGRSDFWRNIFYHPFTQVLKKRGCWLSCRFCCSKFLIKIWALNARTLNPKPSRFIVRLILDCSPQALCFFTFPLLNSW